MANNQRNFLRRLFPTAHKILLDRLVEPRIRGMTGDVLVIGVGKEPYAQLLPLATTICCTDIELGEGIDLVADAHSLPFPDNTFDSVIAIEVFEHLHNPALAANELFRVTRPAGKVLVTVPFLFRVHGDPFDYQRFTQSGLEQLFKNFSLVRIIPFGNRVQVISDLLTTTAKPAVAFRILNHVLCLCPLAGSSSDAPSGYLVELTK